MPPRREIVAGLDEHYYEILSAFTKSMRVSLPVDALYYLFLMRLTTKGTPAHIQMRTLSSGGEDGFAVRPMTHQLTWQLAQKNKELKGEALDRMLELSVFSIAHQHSAYNSGDMGLGWNWTDLWQESWVAAGRRRELGECSQEDLLKGLATLPPQPLDRDGYLYALRFWRMHQNYGRAWESLHKLACQWAMERAEAMEDRTLKKFAEAYLPMARWLSQEHGGVAENWFRRLVYFAARGTKGVRGHSPKIDDADFVEARMRAMRLLQTRTEKGLIKIPCYAYDGKHCWANRGVKDARFCGDSLGNASMYAMAHRDGFLDTTKQGVSQFLDKEEYLANPYLTFKVSFPHLQLNGV
jgi:hypothetical protein